ncbi:hypothetical protein VTN96DRAFT_8113 [Rasamsonia emersonii]|uniref:LYR motif-containing protein 2 n=1 Tax=Rasamsonia emersonii (strain ATCC 16479 / CBS 393.64 / IMI 116815) TaxID=1408163 RepID=A0A0F4YYC7_RASE3|nr:hypothetical protein T310_3355 [Rasamsonia emersonii CBS 393.64]KKA22618.1 hypothetical protein T310_3355 [Rasamsonia emersonii CBS 393.64]
MHMHALIRPSPRLFAAVSHTSYIASSSASSSSSSSSSTSSSSSSSDSSSSDSPSSSTSTSKSKLKKPVLTLDRFIQRQRVLSLWRDIIRTVNKIPPSSTRDELRAYARQEFERNRHVEDIMHIRYLISSGKSEFDTMKRYIDEQVVSR